MFKFLLFDVDDTLLDFKKNEYVALIKTFNDYNIILDEEMINSYLEINHFLWKEFEKNKVKKEDIGYLRFKSFIEKYSLNLDANEVSNRYFYHLKNNPFLMDNAYNLLLDLKDDYKIYLVTNGIKDIALTRLRLTGLDNLVDGIFVSEEIGYNKPNIEYFNYVFDHIENFNKEEALLIGDSLTSDIKGSNNANIKCVYFKHNDIDYSDYKIDYIIENLNELYDILRGE